MSQTLILIICAVVALGIHVVVQLREGEKLDKYFYVFAAVVGGLAIWNINTDVVKAASVMGVIVLAEKIYRFIKKARQ